jgi:hypothetical protein
MRENEIVASRNNHLMSYDLRVWDNYFTIVSIIVLFLLYAWIKELQVTIRQLKKIIIVHIVY